MRKVLCRRRHAVIPTGQRPGVRGPNAAGLGIAALVLGALPAAAGGSQTAPVPLVGDVVQPSPGTGREDAQPLRLAQAQPAAKPSLSVARVVLVEPASEIPLPFRVSAAGTLPQHSFVRLRGLPPAASLSEGHLIGPGSWALPLSVLDSATIKVPAGTTGRSEVVINLVTIEGTLLAEAKTTLVVGPAALVAGAQEQQKDGASAQIVAAPPVPAGRPLSRQAGVKTATEPSEREAGPPSAAAQPANKAAEEKAKPQLQAAAPPVPPAIPPAPPAALPKVALPGAFKPAPSGGTCPAAEITAAPLPAGRMRVSVRSTCRAGEDVTVSYAGAGIIRKLDSAGVLNYELDCFAGTTAPVEISFADNTRRALDVVAQDLDKVSKVAVIWRAPVNLDLHAFEYAAAHNERGHIWSKSPTALQAAREQTQAGKRGHGFMSVLDDGRTPGDKLEVYTFWHNDEQATGAVAMALDFESRGDTPSGELCGSGTYSRVQYEVVILSRATVTRRETNEISPVDCGVRLGREVRYNPDTVPVLRIRK